MRFQWQNGAVQAKSYYTFTAIIFYLGRSIKNERPTMTSMSKMHSTTRGIVTCLREMKQFQCEDTTSLNEQFANSNHAVTIQHLFRSYQHSNYPEKIRFNIQFPNYCQRSISRCVAGYFYISGHQVKGKQPSKKSVTFTKTSD